jgi:hypothetical protein
VDENKLQVACVLAQLNDFTKGLRQPAPIGSMLRAII